MIFQHVLFYRGVNTAEFAPQFRRNRSRIPRISRALVGGAYHEFLEFTVQVDVVWREFEFTLCVAFGEFVGDTWSHDFIDDIFRRHVHVLLVWSKVCLLRRVKDIPSSIFSGDSGGERLRGGDGVVATGC